MKKAWLVALAVGLLSAGCGPAPEGVSAVEDGSARLTGSAPPATSKAPVVDEYHGVEVVDEYRWLEDWSDPAVRSWSEAQNAYARSVLDRLAAVDALREEVTAIRKLEVPRYGNLAYTGGKLFALKSQPPLQQIVLVVMESAEHPASARAVVDPNAIDPEGGTSIDWYAPSPDGALVAVSLSESGSERGNLHVYETATGREVGEVIPRVNYGTAGGSLAWDLEGRGFYYTRYPREGERPEAELDFYVQVYHHRLGTPETEDRYELGEDFPSIAETMLRRSPDGRYVLAIVQNGDSGEFELHLRAPDGRWLRLARYADEVVHGLFGPDESLYLLSRATAPRGELLRISLKDAIEHGRIALAGAEIAVPQSDGVIEIDYWARMRDTVAFTDNRLFVVEGVGGPHRVRVFDFDGTPQTELPLPPTSAVYQVLPVGRGQLLYQTASYSEPLTWRRWTSESGRSVPSGLSVPFPIDFGDIEVIHEWATSKDGTRVPLTILRRTGTGLDGDQPTLLTGYGGFGVSMTPYFDPGLRTWLSHGGVWAIASLRGGGEFGEEWHAAGRLTLKQNVFDDFIACAEHLIAGGYTNEGRLAIEGGSNGGLLMGAALTQRPGLFKAVVAHVGVFDMLRNELDPNGEFNVPEFGSVNDPDQFRALYGYSPYHRVRDGVDYPAVLLLTGANDPRVNPMHSRKMAARLQAAGAPTVLLRTSATSGHGLGTSLDEEVEQEVDVLAFLFHELNMSMADSGSDPTAARSRSAVPERG